MIADQNKDFMSKSEQILSAYQNIREFLLPYRHFWDREVIADYPHAYLQYPKEYIQELNKLDETQLFCLDSKRYIEGENPDPLKGSKVGALFYKIHELEKKYNPKLNIQNPDLLAHESLFLKDKKKYEIERMLGPLLNFSLDLAPTNIYDLGGGVGHLSRLLSSRLKNASSTIKVTSIDRNLEFQMSGKRRWEKIKSFDFHYHHADLEHCHLPQLNPGTFASIGLHTCGELALTQMNSIKQTEAIGVFNVPCCYQHLKIESGNLSLFAKKNPFPWTVFAFTLAAKAHYRDINNPDHKQSFKDKIQVKFYRYALQLLLIENNLGHITSVGEGHLKMYYLPFANYAEMKLKQFGVNHYSAQELNDFYNGQKTQLILKELFLCNLIRWQFGRLLELLIIYDRLLWAAEQNINVDYFTLFDGQISPRNIAVVLKKIK